MIFAIRKAHLSDVAAIRDLYAVVAEKTGGIAREADEISTAYVTYNVEKAAESGYCFVMQHETGALVAEIHTYALSPRGFRHVLSELTLVVHPDFQGQGIGHRIFSHLLSVIEAERPDILRVELITRESNAAGRKLYKRLGFVEEGRFERRIDAKNGQFEADIPMAWFNPNYTATP